MYTETEVTVVVFLILFLIVGVILLSYLLAKSYARVDRCILLVEESTKREKKTQDLARESQDNFTELVKFDNKLNTSLYELSGDWENQAEQNGLVYYIRIQDDDIEISLGFKGWDIEKCHTYGNIFRIPNSPHPREIARGFTKLLIGELMARYAKELSSYRT